MKGVAETLPTQGSGDRLIGHEYPWSGSTHLIMDRNPLEASEAHGRFPAEAVSSLVGA